jgi:hypothetical protein
MLARTFPVLALFALTACATTETPVADTGGPDPNPAGWRLVSGKEPTKAEFAALAATCQDKAKDSIDTCLADLGLKRAE